MNKLIFVLLSHIHLISCLPSISPSFPVPVRPLLTLKEFTAEVVLKSTVKNEQQKKSDIIDPGHSSHNGNNKNITDYNSIKLIFIHSSSSWPFKNLNLLTLSLTNLQETVETEEESEIEEIENSLKEKNSKSSILSDSSSVSGFVKEFPNSFIHGRFTKEGSFTGTLYLYFILNNNVKNNQESWQIHLTQVQNGDYIRLHDKNSGQNKITRKILPKTRSRIRRWSKLNDNYFDRDIFSLQRSSAMLCTLCLVADNPFIQAYGEGKKEILLPKLERLVAAVSWIFRSTDWNGDNFPDNIGFQISRFDVGWDPIPNETQRNYQQSKPAMSLLSKFATLDFSDCCLGIGFTMRPFLEQQVGITFAASQTLLGGICDYRQPSAEMSSANVILISGTGLNNSPLTSTDIEQVLLHELGHAFGVSKHDNALEMTDPQAFRQCTGHDEESIQNFYYGNEYLRLMEPRYGRFLMWSKNQQGKQQIKWNNLSFSSCSKKAVQKILESKRGICFIKDDTPYCGNGILESNEECDCGSELDCHLNDCCGSRTSPSPCRWLHKESKGNRCQPKTINSLSIPVNKKLKPNLKFRGQQVGPIRFNQENGSSCFNFSFTLFLTFFIYFNYY